MSYYRRLLFEILQAMATREYGEQAVKDAVAVYQDTVRESWEKIAAAHRDRGLERFYQHFFAPEEGFEYVTVECSPHRLEVHVIRCKLAEELRAMGCAGIGERFYCDTDLVRIRTFNPGFQLDRPRLLMRGDDRCVFVITDEGHRPQT
ncbi:MAG: L-2-amino-thiazoline-4-carboxylic acid hydrolase [Bacillota bacterium]